MCSQCDGACTCGCSDVIKTRTSSRLEGLSFIDPYLPLICVLIGLLFSSLLISYLGKMTLEEGMSLFMGLFLLVFAGLQTSNIKEYVPSLARYNPLVKLVPLWGFILPPLQLLLAGGFLYDAFARRPKLLASGLHARHIVAEYAPSALHSSPLLLVACIVTISIFLLDAMFVVRSLRRGLRPTCACLGVVLAVPLSPLTVFEDCVMVAMGAYMIFLII